MTGDSVESAYESLSKLDRALVSSAKNASTLSRGISRLYKLQDTKKWEIFSRFISGTGLWRVQNKFRAIVQVMNQFTDAGNKASEASAEQLTKLTELSDSHKVLLEAKEKLSGQIDEDMKKELLANSSKLRALAELTDFETARVKMLEEVNAQIINSDKVLEIERKSMRKALAKDERIKEKKKMKEYFKQNKKMLFADRKNKKIRLKAANQELKDLQRQRAQMTPGMPGRQALESKISKAEGRVGQARSNLKASEDRIPQFFNRSKFGKSALGMFKGWKKGEKKRVAVQKFVLGVGSKLKMFLKAGVMFLGYALLGILGVFLVIGIVKSIWPFLKESWEEASEIFSFLQEILVGSFILVYDAFKGMWDFLVNGEGTWLDFIGYLADLAFGLLSIATVAIVGLLTIAWVGIKGLWKAFWRWVKKDFWTRFTLVCLGLIAVWIIWYYVALAAAAIGITTGLAFAIVAGIALVIAGALRKMKFWEKGGPASGLGVVGEKGPELVKMPAGSRVYSNSDSKKMIAGGSGGNTIHVHVNGRVGASDKEIRDIANKVAKLINVEINRRSNVM